MNREIKECAPMYLCGSRGLHLIETRHTFPQAVSVSLYTKHIPVSFFGPSRRLISTPQRQHLWSGDPLQSCLSYFPVLSLEKGDLGGRRRGHRICAKHKYLVKSLGPSAPATCGGLGA